MQLKQGAGTPTSEAVTRRQFWQTLASLVGIEAIDSVLPERSEMAEWIKIQGTNSEGQTETIYLDWENLRSIPTEKDSILTKIGTTSSGGETSYLLWSPTKKLAHLVKVPARSQQPSTPISPLLDGQPFSSPVTLVREENGPFSLVTDDGKIFKIDSNGNLELISEVRILSEDERDDMADDFLHSHPMSERNPPHGITATLSTRVANTEPPPRPPRNHTMLAV